MRIVSVAVTLTMIVSEIYLYRYRSLYAEKQYLRSSATCYHLLPRSDAGERFELIQCKYSASVTAAN